jgi:hypothetical protein
MDLAVSEADIVRSRGDLRFRQVLLARVLEQLLGRLNREQQQPATANASVLREGAMMAVQLADRIRALDESISPGL